MTVTLRPYQDECKHDIYKAWDEGNQNVLAVLPTGSGKTKILAKVVSEHKGASCVIAHRQELVTQISLALAEEGVRHKIIGPANVVKLVNAIHVHELGKSFYDPNSQCAVAGVDTIVRRDHQMRSWMNSVTLRVTDEDHHHSSNAGKDPNKWYRTCQMFKNAKGLGVTATPLRADGRGLGRHADGLIDIMVEGPQMRWLINEGFLTDYRIINPPSNLDTSKVPVSKNTGDFNPMKLTKACRKSTIMGDVVEHYLRIAKGKLGITFTTDVQSAGDVAARFNDAGVPAAAVSAKTSNSDRVDIIRRFKARELLQLVNCDLFGEGFDLPAIEVVSMARPTQSYGLFVQTFGRGLRLMEGKDRAIIIDHVGNVMRHGLPDRARVWSLDRRDKRKAKEDDDAIPLRTCLNPTCLSVYERVLKVCPFCGDKPVPQARSTPEQVDGDLIELDAETLARMRGDKLRVDVSLTDRNLELIANKCPKVGIGAQLNRHKERQIAQSQLRASIAQWAGDQRALGRSDSESYKRFYFLNKIDVLSAQSLNAKEALILNKKIKNS